MMKYLKYMIFFVILAQYLHGGPALGSDKQAMKEQKAAAKAAAKQQKAAAKAGPA